MDFRAEMKAEMKAVVQELLRREHSLGRTTDAAPGSAVAATQPRGDEGNAPASTPTSLVQHPDALSIAASGPLLAGDGTWSHAGEDLWTQGNPEDSSRHS